MSQLYISTSSSTGTGSSNILSTEARILASPIGFHASYDCIGASPWLYGPAANVVWDWNLINLAFMSIVSFVLNVSVLVAHVTHPPHPKFLLRWPRYISIRLHVFSGGIEIVSSMLPWFLPGCMVFTKIQSISSLVHATTAAYHIPTVFGIRCIMVPAYSMTVLIKVYMAVNVLINPCCYYKSITLFCILSIYGWVRFFITVFEYLHIFDQYRYTVSVTFAGALFIPVIGLSFNIIGLSFICVVCLVASKVLNPSTYAHWMVENHRYFDIHAFKAHAIATTGGSCPFSTTPGKSNSEELAQARTDKLKVFFDTVDIDGDGQVTLSELETASLDANNATLAEIFSMVMSHRGGDTMTFDDVISYTMHRARSQLAMERLLNEDSVKTALESSGQFNPTDEQKARIIFNSVDKDGSGSIDKRELMYMLREFGLPRAETDLVVGPTIIEGKNTSISFAEFKKDYKPFWTYAFASLTQPKHREQQDPWTIRKMAWWASNSILRISLKFTATLRRDPAIREK